MLGAGAARGALGTGALAFWVAALQPVLGARLASLDGTASPAWVSAPHPVLGAEGGLRGEGTLDAAAGSGGGGGDSDEPPVNDPHHRLTRLPPFEFSPSPEFAAVFH